MTETTTSAATTPVPVWAQPLVLTEAEAAELRRLLDDPTARAPEGRAVPVVTAAAWNRLSRAPG